MNLRFPESLHTNRLLLRQLQRADTQALCAYRSLPEVARYQSWETFGIEDANRLLDDQQDRDIWIPGTWLQVALVETGTGQLIGDCGLHCLLEEPRQFEIGVTLSPSRHGRGYATEALDCLLHYLFATLSARRVFATTDALNNPAATLFRRLGFRQEAHHIEHRPFKGTLTSEFVFALLAREWELKHYSKRGHDDRLNSLNEPNKSMEATSLLCTSSTPNSSGISFWRLVGLHSHLKIKTEPLDASKQRKLVTDS